MSPRLRAFIASALVLAAIAVLPLGLLGTIGGRPWIILASLCLFLGGILVGAAGRRE
jgi:hypothetical protein